MTSIALTRQWQFELAQSIAAMCASLRPASLDAVDACYRGCERQSLSPSFRVPPTS